MNKSPEPLFVLFITFGSIRVRETLASIVICIDDCFVSLFSFMFLFAKRCLEDSFGLFNSSVICREEVE